MTSGGQISCVLSQYSPVCLFALAPVKPALLSERLRCGVAGEAKKARKATDDSAKQGKKRLGPPARPP
jgi:hypothetical protein